MHASFTTAGPPSDMPSPVTPPPLASQRAPLTALLLLSALALGLPPAAWAEPAATLATATPTAITPEATALGTTAETISSETISPETILLETVHDFLYQQARPLGDEVQVELQPPAAQLPPCLSPQPFLPANSQTPWGRVTVGVRCADDQAVRYLSAQVTVIGEYLTLSRDLAPGATVDAGMLTATRGDLSRLPATAVLDPAEAIGQVARHRLAAGNPLLRHNLHKPALIKRGEKVTITSQGQGFRVTREGEAMEPGALGDKVRVRLDRNTNLTAVVTGRGQLSVAE